MRKIKKLKIGGHYVKVSWENEAPLMNNLGHKWNATGDGIHTEKTVESLAQALYQVLKDNKLTF